jgi:hypothetical protein
MTPERIKAFFEAISGDDFVKYVGNLSVWTQGELRKSSILNDDDKFPIASAIFDSPDLFFKKEHPNERDEVILDILYRSESLIRNFSKNPSIVENVKKGFLLARAIDKVVILGIEPDLAARLRQKRMSIEKGQEGGRQSAEIRKNKAKHSEIVEAGKRLLSEGKDGHKIAGILSMRFGKTPHMIRRILHADLEYLEAKNRGQ